MTLHIGIDFDNTFVTYDEVFYKYALEQNLIPKEVKMFKQNIRDSIRKLPNGNDRWTELQAYVYGSKMSEARPAEGIECFLQQCRQNSIKISIVSHKTMYPAMGPRVKLREIARQWLEEKGFLSEFGLTNNVSFVGTLDDKIEQIAQHRCTHFIDDLAEVFLHLNFPKEVEKCLYSPNKETSAILDAKCFTSWCELKDYFF